jgi:hypothetical protein
MLREELRRLAGWEERHQRLVARMLLALLLTAAVDVVGSLLIWGFEGGRGDIHGFGDAVFFTTVQLLTISSQIRNPLTAAGKLVDVFLQLWAIFVVTAIAGSFAAFFASSPN